MDLLLCYSLGPVQTNAYAVSNEPGKFLWIDAPMGSFDEMSRLATTRKLRPEALLLTHGHWDHTIDASRFAAEGIPVFAHRGDSLLFEQPSVMSLFALPGLKIEPVAVDHWLVAGDTLERCGIRFAIRETPGHSPGSITFYSEDEAVAFVGDALFAGSVGRTDLPGADFPTLERAIQQQLYTLPKETVCYPGHGPETTVGTERAGNPFVRA